MLLFVFGAVTGFTAGATITRKLRRKIQAITAGTKASVALKGTLVAVALGRSAFGTICRCRVFTRPRPSQEDDLAEHLRKDDRENIMLSTVEAVIGIALCITGRRAWVSSPLRGGFNVFGGDPDLDRLANREKVLAEKLAAFSEALTGGVVPLQHLKRLRHEQSEENADTATQAMVQYAKKAAGVHWTLVTHQFGDAWTEYAIKLTSNGREMKRRLDGFCYPKGDGARSLQSQALPKVVSMTDPVARFSAASRDTEAVLADLQRELGGAKAGWLLSFLTCTATGASLGTHFGMFPLKLEDFKTMFMLIIGRGGRFEG